MGMEHVVRFPGAGSPDLQRVIALLREHSFPVQVRMADGELTLPDEQPPVGWKEVRLGTPSGMVTLLRRGQEVHVVTWGNADEGMQRAWNAVAWAIARAGGGQILRPEGLEDPNGFRASASFPETWRP